MKRLIRKLKKLFSKSKKRKHYEVFDLIKIK